MYLLPYALIHLWDTRLQTKDCCLHSHSLGLVMLISSRCLPFLLPMSFNWQAARAIQLGGCELSTSEKPESRTT
jgi:hypothetical protein